jgi:hypothetical protein
MEMKTPDTALCILNRNEESSILKLLEMIDIKKFTWVFAVDGMSVDNSVNVLNKFGINVIIQKEIGRGNAIKLAIESVIKFSKNSKNLIIISSDGNEDPRDLEKILHLLSRYDLVIASRMLSDSWNEEDNKYFKPRKLTNILFARLAFAFLRTSNTQYISDPLNGLRGFNLDFIKKLELISNGYSIEYEMSIKSYLHNARVIEFSTIEHERSSGKSMVPPIRTVLQLIKILFMVYFSKRKSF